MIINFIEYKFEYLRNWKKRSNCSLLFPSELNGDDLMDFSLFFCGGGEIMQPLRMCYRVN